jgi:uncharacterized protein (DUF433 family)
LVEQRPFKAWVAGSNPAALTISMSIIVKNRDILGGEPVFRGTRVPFQTLLDYLEHGKTLYQFLDEFPTVTRDDAVAALEEAKAVVFAGLK